MRDPAPPSLARLVPLLPELVLVYRRRQGEIPQGFRAAGRGGERHIAAVISLAVAGPATVGQLGQRLRMSTAHASLVVGELARSGLVERRPDERDRRRIIVSLSERARPGVDEIRRRDAAPLHDFLAELDDDEADRFVAQLTKLIGHLARDPPVAPASDETAGAADPPDQRQP